MHHTHGPIGRAGGDETSEAPHSVVVPESAGDGAASGEVKDVEAASTASGTEASIAASGIEATSTASGTEVSIAASGVETSSTASSAEAASTASNVAAPVRARPTVAAGVVAVTAADAVDLGAFTFECGESIPSLEVAYESYGEFTGDNAVLVCHALTGSAHVARRPGEDDGTAGQARAWWADTVGPGKAIDTTEYFVVCANVPGSCYGSTGPASTNPATGEPYGTDFPPVTVGDWTRAQRRLLDELGVGRLHAVVGGSVGGMNVLDWATRYPDDVDRVVPIATAARLDPQCLALDAISRRAITTDPDWNGGDYYGDDRPDPDVGLALARQIGHVMYLSKGSMDGKFGRRSAGREAEREAFPVDPAASFFPYRDVESYLDYNARKFVERFDANSYLYLTRAMDNYDLSAGYDTDVDALAAFAGEALVVSFTADWHFTVDQAAALADAFRETDARVAHHVVDSDHGHDAFLVEPENVNPPLASFLADGVAGRAVTDAGDAADRGDYAPVHSSLF